MDREMFSDVTIVCNGGNVKAHELTLKQMSGYFRTYFSTNVGKSSEIKIDFSSECIMFITDVKYYSKKCAEVYAGKITLQLIIEIMEACDYLIIDAYEIVTEAMAILNNTYVPGNWSDFISIIEHCPQLLLLIHVKELIGKISKSPQDAMDLIKKCIAYSKEFNNTDYRNIIPSIMGGDRVYEVYAIDKDFIYNEVGYINLEYILKFIYTSVNDDDVLRVYKFVMQQLIEYKFDQACDIILAFRPGYLLNYKTFGDDTKSLLRILYKLNA